MTRIQSDYSDPHMIRPERAPDLENEEFLYASEGWPEADVSSPEPDDPLQFSDDHMIRLGLTLDFGPGDLACNQDGVLSPAQIAQVENDLRWFYWSMVAALAVFATLFCMIGFFTGVLLLLLPALIVMGLSLIPISLYKRELLRLPLRQVQHTTMRIGGFALTLRRWGLSDDKQVPVDGGKRVFGPAHLYKVLRANQTYIAYYAPVRSWKGYRLLSLEPMDETWEKPKRKLKW